MAKSKQLGSLITQTPVLMCEGRSHAFGAKWRGEAHEAYRPHPFCKNCGCDLGCQRCSGRTDELLCLNCSPPDWGSVAALEKHGRLLHGADKLEALKFLNSAAKQIASRIPASRMGEKMR
jgi:hypothetical protein